MSFKSNARPRQGYPGHRLKHLQRKLAKLEVKPSSDNSNACSWVSVIHVYRRVYPQMPLEDNSTNLTYVERPNFVFLPQISVFFVSDFFFLYYILEFSNVNVLRIFLRA